MRFYSLFLCALLASPAVAQWNPAAGQWGKVDAADLRVMTYNIEDGLCSSNTKVEGQNDWCGLARLVAAFKPDVLVLEECGDNTGQGTGSGVDSVATLTTVIGMFFHGGVDTFNGSTAITSWVQKYAPTYDLPFVFISSETDGFNRNVILSRYPFTDLNGDTKSTQSDIPTVTATGYAQGGDGGIRGFAFVEIDLPNGTYRGDLVVGGAHMKAGSLTSDHDARRSDARPRGENRRQSGGDVGARRIHARDSGRRFQRGRTAERRRAWTARLAQSSAHRRRNERRHRPRRHRHDGGRRSQLLHRFGREPQFG